MKICGVGVLLLILSTTAYSDLTGTWQGSGQMTLDHARTIHCERITIGMKVSANSFQFTERTYQCGSMLLKEWLPSFRRKDNVLFDQDAPTGGLAESSIYLMPNQAQNNWFVKSYVDFSSPQQTLNWFEAFSSGSDQMGVEGILSPIR